MKNSKMIIIILMTALLTENCGSFKKDFIKNGGKNEAITNAITEFSHTSRTYDKGNIFLVSFKDPFYRMVLESDKDGNSEWVEGKKYEGIIAIDISLNANKIFLATDAKIGSYGKLPSRYIEKDGKLFFWWDNDFPLEEKTLAKLKRFNLLDSDKTKVLDGPSYNHDENSTHYFFCKNDLTIYKKVKTEKGIGYYDIPNINCLSKD